MRKIGNIGLNIMCILIFVILVSPSFTTGLSATTPWILTSEIRTIAIFLSLLGIYIFYISPLRKKHRPTKHFPKAPLWAVVLSNVIFIPLIILSGIWTTQILLDGFVVRSVVIERVLTDIYRSGGSTRIERHYTLKVYDRSTPLLDVTYDLNAGAFAQSLSAYKDREPEPGTEYVVRLEVLPHTGYIMRVIDVKAVEKVMPGIKP